MEKFIGDLKKLEQFISNNPRPAARFVKHAPTRALAFGRKQIPGQEFLASRRPVEIKQARAYLQARRKRASIAYRARRDFEGTVSSLQKQWNEVLEDAIRPETKNPSGKATT
jgi:hypothetical protein